MALFTLGKHGTSVNCSGAHFMRLTPRKVIFSKPGTGGGGGGIPGSVASSKTNWQTRVFGLVIVASSSTN